MSGKLKTKFTSPIAKSTNPWLLDGSFENEALENEDRSTLDKKRRPLNLENKAPKTRKRSTLDQKRSTQNSKTKTPKSRKRR